MAEDVKIKPLLLQDNSYSPKELIAYYTQKAKRRLNSPSDLEPEDMELIASHLSKGGYVETACELAGIRRNTVIDWMEQGYEDAQNGQETPYSVFSFSLKSIQAYAEDRILGLLSGPAYAFWQQHMTILERSRYARWSAKQQILIEDVTGRVNAPPPASSFDSWLSDTRKGLAISDLVNRDAIQDMSCEEIVEAEAQGAEDEVEVISLPEG